MKKQAKMKVDGPLAKRERNTPAEGARSAASSGSQLLASDPPKSTELRDLLGDYSEQTGSFFG